MAKPVKKMPTPLGIGAGQTASVQLPLGLTYERLYIFANVDAVPRDVPVSAWGTYVDEIRLMVDGDTKIQITAADLVSLFEILQALKRFSAENPALYTPDPGFAALVKEGQTFDALNRLGRNRRVIPG